MSQQLPSRPNIEHLKKQAKDALRVFRRHDPRWRLADAQRAIARGYGFPNWPDLRLHVEKVRHERALTFNAAQPTNVSQQAIETKRSGGAAHPIAGIWIAAREESAGRNLLHPYETVVLEFSVATDDIKLTQVATDAAGCETAITMTICTDGQKRKVPFGEGLVLQAHWTSALVLETTITKDERTIAVSTYEVSRDGRSLVVTTAEQLVIFKRI